MAYQARHRDPLLDDDVREALQRRGVELLGFVLLVAAALAAAMLGSYVPDDPGWFAATDTPARNWLGRPGATIASAVHLTIGLAGWAAVLHLGVWGVRLIFHRGDEHAVNRLIFMPGAVALTAVFLAGLTPYDGWEHAFGLGGMFGDTAMGALTTALPLSTTTGLKIVTLAVAFVTAALSLYTLGLDRSEARRVLRFLILGAFQIVDACIALAMGAVRLTARQAVRIGQRRATRAAPVEPAARPTPRVIHPAHEGANPQPEEVAPAEAPAAQGPTLGGLRARPVPGRAPEPARGSFFAGLGRKPRPAEGPAEFPATPSTAGASGTTPTPDRISARIAEAIRARRARAATRQKEATAPEAEPHAPEEAIAAAPAHSRDDADAPAQDAPELPAFTHAIRKAATPQPEARKSVVQHPTPPRIRPSRRAEAEAQPAFPFDETPAEYTPPPLSLLASPETITRHRLSDEALAENARMLETVLADYGVKGEIVSVRPGPVVTMYELEPAPGLKASRVIGLADDIARSMSALSARVSTVPGRSVIGIELPNAHREKVLLREILSTRDYGDSKLRLPLALGKDIAGAPVVANLARMPHLLIAGTTGSGKSVAINTMILSLLYKLSPEECRLIMIDPKMLELSVYDGIPHLLSPVVTDPKKAVVALKWVVAEMEERYRKMSKMGVRNIEGYNARVADALARGETFSRTVQTGFDDETGEPVFETEEFAPETLPYIVVIVDEMADLMMVAGKEIEACIQRLAQMARASGIHLIMATQRPSVDVITGTIKANFPTRISFQVTSKIDSRTILGEQGAEQLLGQGDMLYMAGGGRIQRVHGPFVSDEEVEEVVTYLKSFGPPVYHAGVVEGPDDAKESDIDLVLGLGGNTDSEDAIYDQAVAVVLKDRKCSTSYIQRKLAIGYNKAARLVERMEEEGLVSPANHVGKREILVPEQ